MNFHFWNPLDERAIKKVSMESNGELDLEYSDSEMRHFQLALKSLNPSTLCNLWRGPDELCFSAAGECSGRMEDRLVSKFHSVVKDALHLMCKFCNSPVVSMTSVHRLRPFPVATEGFFCHPEDGAKGSGDGAHVLPTEVQFDGHYMIFNHVLVAKQRTALGGRGRLECSRCGHHLGRTEDGNSLFAIESVNVQLDELDVDGDPIGTIVRPLINSEAEFLHLLCHGLQMNDISRAIVVADTEVGEELFSLWLLEKPGLVFCSSWPEGDSRKVVTPQWSQKVLYQPLLCSPTRAPETESWSRDLSVHRIVLGEALGRRLLRFLLAASLQLPPSARRASVFHVAFLTDEK